MKPLEYLNNVEKGKLLFDLFPSIIPATLDCIKNIAENIASDEEAIRQNWDRQIITVDLWISLAADTLKRIEKNGKELSKNSRRFADQLFDGYNAFFTVHCLQQLIKTEEFEVDAFKKAVEMLYG